MRSVTYCFLLSTYSPLVPVYYISDLLKAVMRITQSRYQPASKPLSALLKTVIKHVETVIKHVENVFNLVKGRFWLV